jgi:hypothetical protein
MLKSFLVRLSASLLHSFAIIRVFVLYSKLGLWCTVVARWLARGDSCTSKVSIVPKKREFGDSSLTGVKLFDIR